MEIGAIILFQLCKSVIIIEYDKCRISKAPAGRNHCNGIIFNKYTYGFYDFAPTALYSGIKYFSIMISSPMGIDECNVFQLYKSAIIIENDS
jgi:hypothetical protein